MNRSAIPHEGCSRSAVCSSSARRACSVLRRAVSAASCSRAYHSYRPAIKALDKTWIDMPNSRAQAVYASTSSSRSAQILGCRANCHPVGISTRKRFVNLQTRAQTLPARPRASATEAAGPFETGLTVTCDAVLGDVSSMERTSCTGYVLQRTKGGALAGNSRCSGGERPSFRMSNVRARFLRNICNSCIHP